MKRFTYEDVILENGKHYIVEVDGERQIALYSHGNFEQMGIDYDHWQYRQKVPEIMIIGVIDINNLTIRGVN